MIPRMLAGSLLLAAALVASPPAAASPKDPVARTPLPSGVAPAEAPAGQDPDKVANPRSEDSLRFESELDARPLRIVLVLASADGREGGPRALQKLIGELGIFADEFRTSGYAGDGNTVYRITGRAAREDSVQRLLTDGRRRAGIELLWVATCVVPAGATDPIPLQTLLWSPRLYPTKGSMVHMGPSGKPLYYIPGSNGEVVEGTWDGTNFRSTYYSLKRPPYVEGQGGPSLNLSALGWQWRVSAWIAEQEKTRQRGWDKYGYIFEKEPPVLVDPDAPGSSSSDAR